MHRFVTKTEEYTVSEKIYRSIGWWESRRLVFNMIIGLAGVIILMFFYQALFRTPTVFAISVIYYVSGANFLYSAGWMLESFSLYYFKKCFTIEFREFLYYTGILFSILLSLSIAISA
jgi:hypothetical protein